MKSNEIRETPASPVTILRPARGLSGFNFQELFSFRELIYFMTWRDIKVRYKQTFLGAAWAILKPLLTMVVFSIFFGDLAKVPSDGVPYPIFSFAALVPWTLFSDAVSNGGRSLVQNRQMITKIYFPRIILPLSAVLGGVVDFLIAFVILVGMMFFYKMQLTLNALIIPLLLLLILIAALGIALWLAALNVQYRDIGYVTPFLTQFWLYITPIAYPASMVPEKWRLLYYLNPMTGVVEGFRWALLGTSQGTPGIQLLVSFGVAILFLITGMMYFRRMEATFADMV